MRSTLFYVPHQLAGWPLFGFGWLLAILALAFVGWTIWIIRQKRGKDSNAGAELISGLPMWAIGAAMIVFVVPNVEQTWPDGTPIGLPIRGYGVMVLLGLLCGIAISVQRGRRLGIEPDTIVGLGFWMMMLGVVGARLFYVAQKWQEFGGASLGERLLEIVKLTEGGLVIYGGVAGGLIGGLLFCLRHKLNIAATADLAAPGFLIGLSLGRIGCLLHGCCFGGVCTSDLPSLSFPHGSGPYQAQLASGQVLGILTAPGNLPQIIESVTDGSVAAEKQIFSGQVLESVGMSSIEPQAGSNPTAPPQMYAEVVVSGSRRTFLPEELPAWSLPTQPSQVYAAINALLLCVLIWHLQPVPSRDGLVFFAAIGLYAVSRFLLEGIRSDESAQLGTSLTISQLISVAAATLAALAAWAIFQRRPGRAWNWQKSA